MKKFNKDSLDSLEDAFAAWAGGYPEDRKETENFLTQSGLKELIAVTDAERLFYRNAYFAEETLLAVYALMPVKVKLASHEEAVLPSMFNRLNTRTMQLDNSQLLNISFGKADEIFCRYYPEKHKILEKSKQKLIRFNAAQRKTSKRNKPSNPFNTVKKVLTSLSRSLAGKKYRETHSEEIKQTKKAYREAHKEEIKLQRKKFYQEHREEILARAKRYRENVKERKRKIEEEKRRLEEELLQRIKSEKKEASRIRNITYREKNRENIRLRANEWRQRLKKENPEILREYDRRANQRQSRAEAGKRYYEKHKEIIAQKAQGNPKAKEYKKRYKAKQRFQKTTQKMILPLLQGIINFKGKE